MRGHTELLDELRRRGLGNPSLLGRHLGVCDEAADAIEELLAENEMLKKQILGKCHFPDGITIKPDGVHELDPCTYEEVERYGNVTISVMRCKNCGHVEINWYRQEDTVELETE